MKNIIGAVLGVTAALVLAGNVSAASSVYTDENVFKAASGAGSDSLNSFGDLAGQSGQIPPLTYKTSANDPKYRIWTPDNPGQEDVFVVTDPGGQFVGVAAMNYGDYALQIDMLEGGRSSALGGNFFITDDTGAFKDGAWMQFKLSNGGTETWNFNPTANNTFFGFVASDTNSYITSVLFGSTNAITPGYYATVSRLYVVGPVQVPEPSVVITNFAVLLSAGVGAVYHRRRNAKRG